MDLSLRLNVDLKVQVCTILNKFAKKNRVFRVFGDFSKPRQIFVFKLVICNSVSKVSYHIYPMFHESCMYPIIPRIPMYPMFHESTCVSYVPRIHMYPIFHESTCIICSTNPQVSYVPRIHKYPMFHNPHVSYVPYVPQVNLALHDLLYTPSNKKRQMLTF